MEKAAIRIMGIDPGLRSTGWGIIEASGIAIAYIASGSIRPNPGNGLAGRLCELHESLAAVMKEYGPSEAAVEETFVNRDPQSALKLGQARAIALVVPALGGLPVAEYAANLIKKTVTGTGHAEKGQIALMVGALLPGAIAQGADAADALAVAITHARVRNWARNLTSIGRP
ncbi:MAG: crossover junction endodeoxyribonuclease RuvC [Beijerinckiaceae bacterium]|nr:crossover junction endodeoxyribonuclease RuvC [Beijerinckiaceae bacterium]MCI0599522.1 crossover junction endodeoxyribonuclease RuvC [Beijerinckiaceae bacterium]MCI0735377.1 crossover junction endodeoxyribonuclease RuvC [Beijerinckiaceae bacterium]